VYIMKRVKRVLTDGDDVEGSSEGDADKAELHGVVVTIPDQQLRVRSNRLYGPIVDVTSGLER